MCERNSATGRALIVYDTTRAQMHVIERSSNFRVFDTPEDLYEGNRGLWFDPRGPDDVVWVHSSFRADMWTTDHILLRQAIDLTTEELVETHRLRLKTEGRVIGPVLTEYDAAGRLWVYYSQQLGSSITVTCADPTDGTTRWKFTLLDKLEPSSKQLTMVFDARGQLWTAADKMIRCYRVMAG